VEGKVQMKLIEEAGRWYWVNDKNVILSPQFDNKARADEWYGLHDTWLERPAIIR